MCGRLPPALAVAAARAEVRPGFPLAALATELHDRAGRLDALDAGDPAASVRAVFSWSCGARDIAGTLGDYQWVPGYYAGMAKLYQQLGNRRGQALCLYGLAALAEYQGHYAEALGHAEQAASLFRSIGDKTGETELLNAAGWYHALLEDYQQARRHCRQALASLPNTCVDAARGWLQFVSNVRIENQEFKIPSAFPARFMH